MALDFINENVGLFFGKDTYENIVLINEINDCNKDAGFICPICGNDIKPRAIHSSKVSPHFYHINATEHDSESILHWWYKNKYLIKGDVFYIAVDGKNHKYICEKIEIEKRYNTSLGDYIPDVVITTNNGEEIFFEYNYTNKKNSDDYAEKWIELERNVVEINIKSIMSSDNKVFRPIFFEGVVCCKSRSERYGVIENHINDLKITDRMRIKYLNGFLIDCMRYNNGDISIDDLSIIIRNMNKQDLMYVPKILKKLKCNTTLDDYGTYIYNQTIQILKDELEKHNLEYDEYKWMVDIGYSIKWAECRGARFDNTIYVKKYKYSSFYNYNRCKYNDVSSGFDVILIDMVSVREEIVSSIENEKIRIRDIKASRMNAHLKIREEQFNDAVNLYIKSLKRGDFVCSEHSVRHSKYVFMKKYVNIKNIIKSYKGIHRYEEINRMFTRICDELLEENKYEIKYFEIINRLEEHKTALDKYCFDLFRYSVSVKMPCLHEYYVNTIISIEDVDDLIPIRIDLKEIISKDEIDSSAEYIIKKLKSEIYKQYSNLNNLDMLKDFIKDYLSYNGSKVRCCLELIDGDVIVYFLRHSKKLKCKIIINEKHLTLNYIDKVYSVKLNNFFEAAAMIYNMHDKLESQYIL